MYAEETWVRVRKIAPALHEAPPRIETETGTGFELFLLPCSAGVKMNKLHFYHSSMS